MSESSRPPLKRKFSSDVGGAASDSDDGPRPLRSFYPRGCAAHGLSDHAFENLPPGPGDLPGVFRWHTGMVQRFLKVASAAQASAGTPRPRVIVTSSYSGMGMAEISSKFVANAFETHGLPFELVCHSQTEISDKCKPCLESNHVFSDLQDRLPKKVMGKLASMQRKHAKAVGRTAAMTKQACSDQFLAEAVKYLEKQGEVVARTMHCDKCGRACSWVPDASPGSLWVEVAGNTCTPWSARGHGLGWLDPKSLPALAWGWSLKHHAPDVIINECVSSWPAEAFFKALFPEAIVGCSLFSPVDLGIPVHRPRKYTVVIPTSSSALSGQFASWDEKVLTGFACQKLQLGGSVFLSAPESEVKDVLLTMANAKQLPPLPSGKDYAFEVVMPTAQRMRMQQFRHALEESREEDLDINADIAHTPQYTTAMRVLPTIIQNSIMFNFAAKRMYLLRELLSAQGIPVYTSDDDPVRELVSPAFMRAISDLRAADLHSMIGNSMCLCQVGAPLVFVVGKFLVRKQ